MRFNFSISIITTLLILSALPLGVGAATLSMSPGTITVQEGQNFNLSLTLNPAGKTQYTTKVELSYPADLLEVKIFSFGGTWLPLVQSGYDLIDNVSGKIIKTAGYPGGTSAPTKFGTITFKAKRAGSANLDLLTSSLSLDASGEDTLSGTGTVGVSISAPPKIEPKPQISEPDFVAIGAEEEEEKEEEQVPVEVVSEVPEEAEQVIGEEIPPPLFDIEVKPSEMPAQEAEAGKTARTPVGIFVVIGLALLAIIYFVVRKISLP